MVSYLNAKEVRTSSAVMPGRMVQIAGIVKPRSIVQDGNTDGISFRPEDKDSPGITIPVVYSGILPDEFKPGLTVVVEGTVIHRKFISADHILKKCASKYTSKITKRGGV